MVKKKYKKQDYDRGKITEISLTRAIIFNSNVITKAVIEIDHINYGLNEKTGKLNPNKRLNFTVNDIKKFIMELDGEDVHATKHEGYKSIYMLRVDCPIKGRFFGKEFIMIVRTDYKKTEEIHTITLFPGW